MTTYEIDNSNDLLNGVFESNPLRATEQYVYGSERLGVYKPENSTATTNNNLHYVYETGLRNYELKNHLGNVMAVISDKKKVIQPITGQAYFKADVIAANDYYLGGYQIKERTAFNSTYRFSFNGAEQNDEISGDYEIKQMNFSIKIIK